LDCLFAVIVVTQIIGDVLSRRDLQ